MVDSMEDANGLKVDSAEVDIQIEDAQPSKNLLNKDLQTI